MGNIFDRTKSWGAKLFWNNLGIRIAVQRRRRCKWPGEENRFDYQKRYVKFDIKPGDQVLDIGSGGYPFPYATVLTDRFLGKSPYRFESLVRDTRPFLLSDIHELPFHDKSFDFVYCTHVLEVVENPLRACLLRAFPSDFHGIPIDRGLLVSGSDRTCTSPFVRQRFPFTFFPGLKIFKGSKISFVSRKSSIISGPYICSK